MINLAARSKIITVAHALRCVSNVKQGKACSMQDAKATMILLDTALKTARRTGRATKKALVASDNMVTRLLGKIGL